MAFATAGFCVTWLPRLLTFTRLCLLILPRLAGLAFTRFAWLLPRFTWLTFRSSLFFPTRLTRFARLSGFPLLNGLTFGRLLSLGLFGRLPCRLFCSSPLCPFLVDHF